MFEVWSGAGESEGEQIGAAQFTLDAALEIARSAWIAADIDACVTIVTVSKGRRFVLVLNEVTEDFS